MDDRAAAILRAIAVAADVPLCDLLRPVSSPLRAAAARVLRGDGYTWPEVGAIMGADEAQLHGLQRMKLGRILDVVWVAYSSAVPPRVEEVPVTDWPAAIALCAPCFEVIHR